MWNTFKKLLCMIVVAVLFFVSVLGGIAGAIRETDPHNQLSIIAFVSELPEDVLEFLRSGKNVEMRVIYSWWEERDSGGAATYNFDDTIEVLCRGVYDRSQYKIGCLDYFGEEACKVTLGLPCGKESTRFLENVNSVNDRNLQRDNSPYFCYLEIMDRDCASVGYLCPCVLTFPLEKSVQLLIVARAKETERWRLEELSKTLERAGAEGVGSEIIFGYQGDLSTPNPKYTLDAVCMASKTLREGCGAVLLRFPYDQKAVRFITDIRSVRTEPYYEFNLRHEGRTVPFLLNTDQAIEIVSK